MILVKIGSTKSLKSLREKTGLFYRISLPIPAVAALIGLLHEFLDNLLTNSLIFRMLARLEDLKNVTEWHHEI